VDSCEWIGNSSQCSGLSFLENKEYNQTMKYCYVNWKQTPDGFTPDLPEDKGFALIAEPSERAICAGYALFKFDYDYDEPLPQNVHEVPEELETLIMSAEDYPPALALTRDRAEKESPPECNQETFSAILIQILTEELEKQTESKYFLAKAIKDEIGYLCSGGYYWIVGYDPIDKFVSWVSWDFFVYRNPIGDFELSEEELISRF